MRLFRWSGSGGSFLCCAREKVMLDRDLAELYGVETKRLMRRSSDH